MSFQCGFRFSLLLATAGLIAILGSSCARTSQGQVDFGKTTAAQLTSQIGGPDSTSIPKVNAGAEILEYHSDCSFQKDTKTQIIQARFCEPHGEQLTLQYWRHQWRGVRTSLTPVPSAPAGRESDPHTQSLLALDAPTLHTTVVYDPTLDRVVRVVNYGSK